MEKKIYVIEERVLEKFEEYLGEALEALKGDESQHLAYRNVRDVQDQILEYMIEQNIKV